VYLPAWHAGISTCWQTDTRNVPWALFCSSRRVKKTRVFLKAQPSGFLGVFGFYWVFLDKQEKIGKIIQKLSNLKP